MGLSVCGKAGDVCGATCFPQPTTMNMKPDSMHTADIVEKRIIVDSFLDS
jgi:hypothetical protein